MPAVYFGDGRTQIGTFGQINRTVLTSFPPLLEQAFFAAEDRNFQTEGGISLTGTARALYVDLTGGSVQGGSTITEELIKNYYEQPGAPRTLSTWPELRRPPVRQPSLPPLRPDRRAAETPMWSRPPVRASRFHPRVTSLPPRRRFHPAPSPDRVPSRCQDPDEPKGRHHPRKSQRPGPQGRDRAKGSTLAGLAVTGLCCLFVSSLTRSYR